VIITGIRKTREGTTLSSRVRRPNFSNLSSLQRFSGVTRLSTTSVNFHRKEAQSRVTVFRLEELICKLRFEIMEKCVRLNPANCRDIRSCQPCEVITSNFSASSGALVPTPRQSYPTPLARVTPDGDPFDII